MGLDLAGSPRRATGFCLLTRGKFVRTTVLGPDEEILEKVRAARPDVLVIDAPLSLPRGRESLERPGPPHLRACDRELLRLGIRFFPLTLGPMRLLTARGLRLKAAFASEKFPVFEGYPGGTQDLLGWPRKSEGVPRLQRALRRFGFRGDVAERRLTHDELDAVAIAWTGGLFLRGKATEIGDPTEGTMLFPAPEGHAPSRLSERKVPL
ncbi:MAG TPA: DUF429 domain-containing protein [Thermoplasmata archaeon]|nr:DUF429 domain-containing protein [Thermoplasmata archaeon]